MTVVFWSVISLFLLSQLFWVVRIRSWLRRHVSSRRLRMALGLALLLVWVLLFADTFVTIGPRQTATYLTAADALRAPFKWWAVSSLAAFLVALPFAIPRALARRAANPHGVESPARRQFLEHTANLVVAAPFVAGGYGLFYGRLNLETTTPRIRLARLPKAFNGFRIAQLSDIHIGPFMTEEQIRRFVAITNSLKPDLIALTGDFVTFDPSTERAVVNALADLKAPFGVYGSLGNHDVWSGVQESLPRLFAKAGIRILRYEQTRLAQGGESLNLIGVDFESLRFFGPSDPNVHQYLERAAPLIAPDTANILLSHNPDTFDRAAELGIDLSLAGHTHGGQLALEFISPQIAPSRLMTPYVAGRFEKPGGQLYVNRGIGTIGIPIRLGAPPEITVFELVRA